MARMLGDNETAFDSASSQFWVVDAKVSNCNCSLVLFNASIYKLACLSNGS